MVSITHCSLKAMSFSNSFYLEMMGKTYIPRTGEGVRSLGLSGSSLYSSTSNHILSRNSLQYSTPQDQLYN